MNNVSLCNVRVSENVINSPRYDRYWDCTTNVSLLANAPFAPLWFIERWIFDLAGHLDEKPYVSTDQFSRLWGKAAVTKCCPSLTRLQEQTLCKMAVKKTEEQYYTRKLRSQTKRNEFMKFSSTARFIGRSKQWPDIMLCIHRWKV